jgi:hypothetical protein
VEYDKQSGGFPKLDDGARELPETAAIRWPSPGLTLARFHAR